MKIKFIGAAQTVTGSAHLIETGDVKFLLDFGLYQGRRKHAFELNRQFDLFDPKEIDFMILSHAHIDHSGNIPTLVKKGFRGHIFTTFATRDLVRIMLEDSAHLQENDVYFINKRRIKQGKKPFEPLYTVEDARASFTHFVGVNYHHKFQIGENIAFTFYDAGHILGSAITVIEINEKGKKILIGFTGDLGRPNRPILRDPEKIPDVDIIISESTYGDRLHDKHEDVLNKFAELIKKAIKRKSKIIIPAFSVGRTQELVYDLHKLFDAGLAPRIPVYVDSPLAVNATEIFRMHPECFDAETSDFIFRDEDPFGFNRLTYIRDKEASKALNKKNGPMIIISASGMCEGGRIVHHLANNIENPQNIIMIVGYSAEHTLCRKIMDGEKQVNILGEPFQVNAEVVIFNSFSGHADRDELLAYFKKFDKSRVQKFFLVHGEREAQEAFKGSLENIGFRNIEIPKRGYRFEF